MQPDATQVSIERIEESARRCGRGAKSRQGRCPRPASYRIELLDLQSGWTTVRFACEEDAAEFIAWSVEPP